MRSLLGSAILISATILGCASHEPGPTDAPIGAVRSFADSTMVPVVVRYTPSAPASRLTQLKQAGARGGYDITSLRAITLKLPRSLVDSLAASPWVEGIEFDTATAFLAADIVSWGLTAQGTNAIQVHPYARGAGVKVAVFDTGIRCGFPDLTARVVGGYDFIADAPVYCHDNLPNSEVFHATSVTQILAGSINGVDYLGMAPEVQVYMLRVCEIGSSNGICTMGDIAAALDWARLNGIKLVSASLGHCVSSLIPVAQQAMTLAYQAGILQVWATGNAECVGNVSPWLKEAGVVGATAQAVDGSYVSIYAHNQYVDLAAPHCVNVKSTYGGSVSFCGTSASVPHVAGAAALLMGLGFTGIDLISQRLTSTATDRGSAGYDIYYGYGTLNASVAATRRPIVDSVSGTPQPITSAGTYLLQAAITYGIAPIDVQWNIDYSDATPDVTTGWGSPQYQLNVHPGDYFITVTATPKERTYLRVGVGWTYQFAVCTTAGGSGGANAIGGCGPPDPPL